MKGIVIYPTLILVTFVFILACGSGGDNKNSETSTPAKDTATTSAATTGAEKRGVGKFQNVPLTHPLDQTMVTAGKTIYDLKCVSCHKLTEEKLVGPGWKGVTDRRTPEWIMNFVTNTEEMLEKNQQAKNLYEICLVKMPNQNLTDDDARHMLEFMRNNDGKK